MRIDVSGLRAPDRTEHIHRHAERMSYAYVYTVRPPADGADPTGYALVLAAG
ncbi:hypothetical protein ACWDXV_30445 [Nocardia nova]